MLLDIKTLTPISHEKIYHAYDNQKALIKAYENTLCKVFNPQVVITA